jgi:hypothetical protein
MTKSGARAACILLQAALITPSETTCQGKNNVAEEVAQSLASQRLCGFSFNPTPYHLKVAQSLVFQRLCGSSINPIPYVPEVAQSLAFQRLCGSSINPIPYVPEVAQSLVFQRLCGSSINPTPYVPEVAQSLAFQRLCATSAFALEPGKGRRVSGKRDSALPGYQAFFVPAQLGV